MPLRWFWDSSPITTDIQPRYRLEHRSILHSIKYLNSDSTAPTGSVTFTIYKRSYQGVNASVTSTIASWTINSVTQNVWIDVLREKPIMLMPGDELYITQSSTLTAGCYGLNIHLDLELDF